MIEPCWFSDWICHGMWLVHLHSTVNIQPFSPVFPLAGSTAKAFCRLSLWSFKEKASTIFYYTAFLFDSPAAPLFSFHNNGPEAF